MLLPPAGAPRLVDVPSGSPPPRWTTIAFLALLVGLTVGFGALGDWQLHRLVWKLRLISEVNARVHGPPSPAPGQADWPSLTPANAVYRRVEARGVFRNDRETTVQALTELGAGYWVLTPMVTPQGFTVLVNRGFVPPDRKAAASRPDGQIGGPTTVTGLLRISEPGGGFLQRNDPQRNRWYSRDVEAIAAARRLGRTAPYFIDAEAARRRDAPMGGLTVIAFPNSHLAYALTWFALALMCGGAAVRIGWMAATRKWGPRPAASEAAAPFRRGADPPAPSDPG